MCTSVVVSHIDTDRFDLYTVEDATWGEIAERECNIYWTASGFTC